MTGLLSKYWSIVFYGNYQSLCDWPSRAAYYYYSILILRMSSNLWFISTIGILMLSGFFFLVVVVAELRFLARLPALVADYVLLGVASLSINSCILSALCSYSAFAAPVVLWWICWLLWFLCRFSTIGWISFLSLLKLYLYCVFLSTSWI